MAADKGFSLPTAQQVMEKLALAEAEKASPRTQAGRTGIQEDAARKDHQAVRRV
jgi:hypothetical protein